MVASAQSGSKGKSSATSGLGVKGSTKVTKKSSPSPPTTASNSGALVGSASRKATGTTQLPASRIKRIIKEDKDVHMVSHDAIFLISFATELFLESFAKKAFDIAKVEKRKTISYKDLANAVQHHDSLEFLQDIVPRTMLINDAIERQRISKEKEEMGFEAMDEEGEEDNVDRQSSNDTRESSVQQQDSHNSSNNGHGMDDDDDEDSSLSEPEDMDRD